MEYPLQQAKLAYEMMDDREIPMKFIILSPGESYELSSSIRIVAFETNHRVPSQGYAIYKKSKGNLLPQYVGIANKEIGQLKKAGTQIFEDPYETLEVVYTGDTLFDALLRPENLLLFNANLFFIELTYLDGDRGKASSWFHVHLEDIIENSEMFDNVGTVIFVHLSQKYSYSRAIDTIRNGLPSTLLKKAKVSLRSFGASENLTSLSDSQWEKSHDRVPGWGWSSYSSSVSSSYHSYPSRGNSSFTGRGFRGRGRVDGRVFKRGRSREGRYH
jgi:hypothetical protein